MYSEHMITVRLEDENMKAQKFPADVNRNLYWKNESKLVRKRTLNHLAKLANSREFKLVAKTKFLYSIPIMFF